MYDYGFRDYSPASGRFTTVDPIRDGSNWFSYCINDGVNYIDYFGLDTTDVNFAFKSNVIGQNVGFTGFNIQLETKAALQKASYPTTSGKTTEGVSKTNKFFSKENISESLHTVLDAAGCIPAFGVVPDALNGIYYLVEGNKLAAGMSFLAVLPYGDVIKGAKYGSKLGKEIVENGIEYAVKKGTKETGEELIETTASMVAKGGKTIGTYGELVSSGQKDAHHIIQDAAMRDIPGYSRMDAPAIQLNGPSNVVGTEHYFATITQRRSGGRTYGAERGIAYMSLRKAGLSIDEAKTAVRNADNYFMGKLGLSLDTPTRIPGNRSK